MNKKAVLFDFDGVLANTMEDLYRAWSHAVYVYGKKRISKTFLFQLEGMSPLEMADRLFKKYNLKKELIDATIKLKDENYFNNNKFELNKHIIKAITILKKRGILIALVSGAKRERLIRTFSREKQNLFEIIITSDDVNRGKPHPDPYLKALDSLKINAEEAIVVENAPLGIRSAKSAGIFCVAIASTLKKKYLIDAEALLKDVKYNMEEAIKKI